MCATTVHCTIKNRRAYELQLTKVGRFILRLMSFVCVSIWKRVRRFYGHLPCVWLPRRVDFSFSIRIDTLVQRSGGERVPAVDSGRTTWKLRFTTVAPATCSRCSDKWISIRMNFSINMHFAISPPRYRCRIVFFCIFFWYSWLSKSFRLTGWCVSFQFFSFSFVALSCLINSFGFFLLLSTRLPFFVHCASLMATNVVARFLHHMRI